MLWACLMLNSYDLILLDVKMPEISGFDLCAEIKKLTEAPVVFLSSLAEKADQIRGFAAGGADYIQKDCPHELFWAKLQARLTADPGNTGPPGLPAAVSGFSAPAGLYSRD